MSGFQESKDDQNNAPSVRTQSGMKRRKLLTQERVRELFDLDEETGIMRRRLTLAYNAKEGDVVGYRDKTHGYLTVRVDGRLYFLHRIIFLYVHGYTPEHQVDHQNRNKLDNRPVNLREITPQCNVRNSPVRSDNKTGIKGVTWCRRDLKWKVRVYTGEGETHLGRFEDLNEAVAHRLAAEQCLDWPDCDSSSSAYQYMQRYLNGELDDKVSN